MAAGDIACGTGSSGAACKQQATANVLIANNPDVVMPLGDNQYECGLLGDFRTYYDPSWGALKAKTRPSVGNHEYNVSTSTTSPCYNVTAGAPGYYTYFGDLATPLQPGCTINCSGYYSYNLGGWHFIVLNTNCSKAGGCGLGSPQEKWLKADLAANPTACTVAYWHHPRYSSGYSGSQLRQERGHPVAGPVQWRDRYRPERPRPQLRALRADGRERELRPDARYP